MSAIGQPERVSRHFAARVTARVDRVAGAGIFDQRTFKRFSN